MSNWFTKLFGGKNKMAAVEPQPLEMPETPQMPEAQSDMGQAPVQQPENHEGGETQTN